ncbi:MAG TPA: hypothetical protein ENJ23_05120 [Bacteroidetes bacterium]|nr:hypothetical protein [Bacteroidota bacterium]
MQIELSQKSQRRWLLGCGVAAVLALAIGAGAFYFVLNKVRSVSGRVELEPREYTSLLEQDTFVPPEDGLVSEADLRAYLDIVEEIRGRLDRELSREGTHIDWEKENLGSQLLGHLYLLRKVEAEVLKKHDFSPHKFKWISRQLILVFGGSRLKQYNLLLKAVTSGEKEIQPIEELKQIPQENLELFARYEQEIRRALRLWILGV